jgi:glycosyltransferase involved in cell wall biosynthesis
MSTLTLPDATTAAARARPRLKVLFFVEGFTDIRFVKGLSEICDLTMLVASEAYRGSGLRDRVAAAGVGARVEEIPGGRLSFQVRSIPWLLRHAREFDVILSQEVLRGSFNATTMGTLLGVPVVTYMGIAPVEYFRCRRERKQISAAKAWLGETVIRFLMRWNGRRAARTLAMGPYLRDIAAKDSKHAMIGLYYGVDTEFFRPATADERRALRARRDLPQDKFIIFLSSRISHEKDPETVLRATAQARAAGLDAVVINLGGGYRDFLKLAHELGLPDVDSWVLGRPAAHPMTEVADYFRAADVMALASLAEGAAYSTLEALSCATPVVATDIGGMAVQLKGYARLTPRQDADAMAREFLWIAAHPDEARAQAMRGREMILRDWNREKAFGDLRTILETVVAERAAR